MSRDIIFTLIDVSFEVFFSNVCNYQVLAIYIHSHTYHGGSLLIGLTRSEKTSVMTTPKRPGAHIWQICLADLPPNRAKIP